MLLAALVMAMAGGAQAAPALGSAGTRSTTAAPSDASGPAASTSHTAVRIVVPPMDVILVNANGVPVAVETNTNRAPRQGDMFFATDSPKSDTLATATAAQTDQVLKVFRPVAVWQPGWHYIQRRSG
jgi:hypothetical protein